MPQLDIVTLFSQVFWLTLTWVRSYLVVTQRILPPIVKLLKLRQQYKTEPGTTTEETTRNTAKDNFYQTRTDGMTGDIITSIKDETVIQNGAQASLKSKLAAEELKRART